MLPPSADRSVVALVGTLRVEAYAIPLCLSRRIRKGQSRGDLRHHRGIQLHIRCRPCPMVRCTNEAQHHSTRLHSCLLACRRPRPPKTRTNPIPYSLDWVSFRRFDRSSAGTPRLERFRSTVRMDTEVLINGICRRGVHLSVPVPVPTSDPGSPVAPHGTRANLLWLTIRLLPGRGAYQGHLSATAPVALSSLL